MGIISCGIMPGKSSGARACPRTCFFLSGLMSLAWGRSYRADTHMGLTLLMHTGLPSAFQALLMHTTKYDKSYPCLLYVMM